VSRVAVITGAGSGMGLTIAERHAQRGDKVALLDLNGEAAEEVAARLRAEGYTAIARQVDVSDRAAVFSCIEDVRAELGPIEIMVTSAGIEAFVDFLDITEEGWDKMIAVNLSGTFHCLQAAIPDMLAGGWGRVVTISSSSAQHGTKRMANYVASKGGVIGLTKALAMEYAANGITVNTIPPGFIETPMLHRPIDEGTMPPLEVLVQRAPMGHPGQPEDIAAACIFLTSEEAGYITGQQINVNGGWYL
jgi:NAD(P)-dependent dehydrogenase (short-subunit alcohol dehydrogenase family)